MRCRNRTTSVLGVLGLALSCATSPASSPGYDFFAPATPDRTPWREKIEDWQQRMHREAGARVVAKRLPRPAEQQFAYIGDKIGSFVAGRRQELARQVAVWTLAQGRQHYKWDQDPTLEGDHWPTYRELADKNGDDCDGLDLIGYQLLLELGFPRDQVFRAVVRKNDRRVNHMVTLWFEDPDDPWVFDATGAMTRRFVRFSATVGWTPTAVFNEDRQFAVTASDGRLQIGASRAHNEGMQ